jgi:YbbR domain-containing protein
VKFKLPATSHVGLLALSLALAILLWLIVSGEESVERGMRVPLELVQFPAGLEVQAEAPTVVDVRVRGSSTTLSQVGPGDIVAFLDLHTTRPGRRVFPLTPEQVRAPFGVQVVQVTPASITMTFETTRTQTVPINAGWEGTPAPGYVVGKITVDPKMVEITGPDSAVKQTMEALTEPVQVGGARESVTDTVTIGLLDPTVRLKTPRPATVKVEILPGPRERMARGQPVRLRNIGPNLSAEAVPPTVDVLLRGSREGLSRVDASEIVAYVDLAGLGPGEYPLQVLVDASPDAGAARIEPATVLVRIIRP